MNASNFDPVELRRSMRVALDLVAAHRIAKGLSFDLERMTCVREALEERLTQALGEIDMGSLPSDWSWSKASETLSIEIAMQTIREQKNELPDPAHRLGERGNDSLGNPPELL